MSENEDFLGKLTPEQRGEILRFFLEQHDQKSFTRGVDGSAIIPGKDTIEALLSGEQLPKEGFIVHAEVRKGYEGVVKVYKYTEFKARSVNDYRPKYDQVRASVDIEGDEWVMAYENPNYAYKNTEPYDRMQPTSYTGLGFSSTDIFPLQDGGRFFIAKQPLRGSHGTSFDHEDGAVKDDSANREVTVCFEKDDIEGAKNAIKAVMTKLIGVLDVDSNLMLEEVETRLKR